MIADANTSLAQWWGPALAFFAGIVSFASPCVLPLVPGYLSFVMGESAVETAGTGGPTCCRCCCSSRGFTLVFVLYGAFAHEFVRAFKGRPGQIVAGVVIGLLGALMIGYGLRRGSLTLYAERRPLLAAREAGGRRGASRSGWRSRRAGRRASAPCWARSRSWRRR